MAKEFNEKELSQGSIELLEVLRNFLIQKFERAGVPEIVQIFKNMPYDWLVRVLHYGFSEETFFESMKGNFKPKPFKLSMEDLEKIRKNMKRTFR
jgi:hypothetical protein